MSVISDIILSVTVFLLAILNVNNRKRIDNLEKWVNVLIYGKEHGHDTID